MAGRGVRRWSSSSRNHGIPLSLAVVPRTFELIVLRDVPSISSFNLVRIPASTAGIQWKGSGTAELLS